MVEQAQPHDDRPEDAPAPSRASDAEGQGGISPSGKRALLLCIAVLLLLEFGAARREWIWQLDPRRPVGIMLAVEDRIIEPADDPRVVVLGSSVMRDAVLPRVFEEAAGLPRGSVLNTSLPNATPFDFVLLYERNRDVLRTTRLLLVGVEDWYFYEEPGVSERYHLWASLGERVADYEGSARLPLLVSWVWKTYAARQALTFSAISARLAGDDIEVIGEDGRTRWRPEEREQGPEALGLSAYEARLRERVWRDRQVRYLREVAELAATDDVPLVFVRMPMRDAALERRARIDPDAERRLQGALDAVRDLGSTTVLDLPGGEQVGLEPSDFLDERHLALRGADKFTTYLASWAAREFDLR